MTLDLTSLEKAATSLERAVEESRSGDFMDKLTPVQQNLIRAGVIQNFEFTFELCWKFMQRWIRLNRAPEDADNPRTRKELFRLAARCDLIENPLPWFGFAEARNLTAHTYDAKKAEEVYRAAVDFVAPAKYLLNQLRQKND